MTADETFRFVLLAVILVVLPIGLYHRIRSQATREPLDRRQEGVFILATLRPAGLAFFAGLIAYLVSPASMARASMPLPVAVRWLGVGIGATAAILLTWTFRRLGKNITDTVVTRRDHTLVLHGPYRWVRHPFYGSVTLFLLALSLIAANWFLLLTGAVVVTLLVIRTRREEDHLVRRFGDDYRRYMNRTGRFLPRWGARAE
jgi:protein-S-isoprenylcysteine O-methyltransferase Ste14